MRPALRRQESTEQVRMVAGASSCACGAATSCRAVARAQAILPALSGGVHTERASSSDLQTCLNKRPAEQIVHPAAVSCCHTAPKTCRTRELSRESP